MDPSHTIASASPIAVRPASRKIASRAARAMATTATTTMEAPPSPDPPNWGSNCTPSKDTPNGWVQVVGRRQARILHGQDPVKNPEKFTPRVNLTRFAWPSNDEASAWAVANVSSRKMAEKARAQQHAGSGWRQQLADH